VSKLHYFAVNEHTKYKPKTLQLLWYKPIPCELDDDDKYRVKKPTMIIQHVIERTASSHSMTLGFSYFPSQRGGLHLRRHSLAGDSIIGCAGVVRHLSANSSVRK